MKLRRSRSPILKFLLWKNCSLLSYYMISLLCIRNLHTNTQFVNQWRIMWNLQIPLRKSLPTHLFLHISVYELVEEKETWKISLNFLFTILKGNQIIKFNMKNSSKIIFYLFCKMHFLIWHIYDQLNYLRLWWFLAQCMDENY